MKTCETCRWWAACSLLAVRDSEGVCERVVYATVKEARPSTSGAWIAGVRGYAPGLVTPKDFACNQWEAKEKESGE